MPTTRPTVRRQGKPVCDKFLQPSRPSPNRAERRPYTGTQTPLRGRPSPRADLSRGASCHFRDGQRAHVLHCVRLQPRHALLRHFERRSDVRRWKTGLAGWGGEIRTSTSKIGIRQDSHSQDSNLCISKLVLVHFIVAQRGWVVGRTPAPFFESAAGAPIIRDTQVRVLAPS